MEAENHVPSTPPQEPPEAPPVWWLLVLGLPAWLFAPFVGRLLGVLAWGGEDRLGELIGTQLAFLVTALAWVRLSDLHALPLLRLSRPLPRSLLLAATVSLGAVLAGAGLTALLRTILQPSVHAPTEAIRALSDTGAGPWLLLAIGAVLPGLCEEVAFRGALQTALLRGHSPGRAIFLGALIFAAIHFDLVRFPDRLLGGLAYGWLAWRTGSIWPGVLAHTMNNGVVVAAISFAPAPSATKVGDLEFLPFAAGSLALGLAILAMAASGARRWLPPAPDAASFLVQRDTKR